MNQTGRGLMLKDVGRQGPGSHADERSLARMAMGWQPRCGAGWRGECGEETERDETVTSALQSREAFLGLRPKRASYT